MKSSFKLSQIGMAAALVLGFSSAVSAQSLATDLTRRAATVTHAKPGSVLTAAAKAEPVAVVKGFLRGRGLGETTIASLQVSGAVDARSGISHLRLGQQVDGLTVYGSYVKAAVNSRGELVHLIDRVATVSDHPTPAGITAAKALSVAMGRVHPEVRTGFTPNGRSGNLSSFAGGSFFHADPTVTTVAIARSGDRLETAYLVETWSEKKNLLNHTLVSGRGEVLSVELRTASDDAYKVFVEDPLKGSQVIVKGPAPGGVESPLGWLATTPQKTTRITGNNVQSYLDVDANNIPDHAGKWNLTGKFVTPVDLTVAPTTAGNRAVAVQNLFYFNNTVHDRLYDFGFTEAAGNFQTDNLGKGGLGEDAVRAEAQDGSGTDNANFSTPVDGKKPRMQMYLWTGAGPTHQVHENAPSVADFNATPAVFGAQLDATGVTAAVQVANDGTGVTSDACEPIAGSLAGQIALVDRGTCAFTIKVKNVQNAGAVGALVVNNTGTTDVFVMGGDDATVTIPALMVGVTDGTTLRNTAGLNVTLRALAVQPLQIDATLDADVVYHEYGHGLSWRLVGGMSGPLAGAIGEGASDGLAMLMNGDDVIGEYSASNPTGIRRYPYAGYPLTYADVTGAEVHNDGEIYAAVVWRLIELFGTAGHDTWFGYFVDGMKYTPETPAYEDMRNGILDSIGTAGKPVGDCALVWQAFAQFGIGDGAKGVVNADSTVTITPSFTARSDCSH